MSLNTSLSKPCSSLWDLMQWQPNPEQINQFLQLQSLLKFWNNQINLTRLIDGDDYWVGQIFDSLWPYKEELQDPVKSFLGADIGSGCGFPGLALAIAFPQSKFTLIESITRKTLVLETITKELGLSERISILNERVEKSAHKSKLRGKFDIAMARAVANTPVISEYLVPLLNKNGQALIYRGKWSQEEQKNLTKVLQILNAKIKSIQKIDLPKNRGERHLVRIISTGICPRKYPRKIGLPSKKPLGD